MEQHSSLLPGAIGNNWRLLIVFFVGLLLLGTTAAYFEDAFTAPVHLQHNPIMQRVRTLGVALSFFAQDHGGKYPQGQSSTEVFQQLIDQGYAFDPEIFFFPMTGKTKPTSSMLKPENVCWDVTGGITKDDSDDLPVVFMTGYKMDYRPNAIATPLKNTDPDGFAVYFMGNNAINFKIPLNGPTIQSTFDAKGKTYVQLTPDGPLP